MVILVIVGLIVVFVVLMAAQAADTSGCLSALTSCAYNELKDYGAGLVPQANGVQGYSPDEVITFVLIMAGVVIASAIASVLILMVLDAHAKHEREKARDKLVIRARDLSAGVTSKQWEGILLTPDWRDIKPFED